MPTLINLFLQLPSKICILLTALLLLPSASWAECKLAQELHGQKHFVCQAPNTSKSVHVLELEGDFAKTAYYHGRFLQHQIERGVLAGVQIRTERALGELDRKDREKILLIKKCVINNYRSSVSRDFKTGLENLYSGMRDAGSTVSWKAFEESNYMVEFSIFMDSLQRQMSQNSTKTSLKVFSSCAPYFVGNALLKPIRKIAKGLRSIKMGCTGISASANGSKDGALIHGRNFDSGLLGYYENDQVIVINRQKNGITSVGIASAGLHYAGGISGFNNYGLSVSLHELQTEGVKISYASGHSDIGPYLLHSVVQKARTLDEAIAIIKNRKGFGAWTFFISDAKSDESASIELSGDTVVVARRQKHRFMGQSNHFLAPATAKEGYEYSLNKTLETRARLAHVHRTLQEDFGRLDFQWVIDRLTGHYDELVGERSFGRTTTKVYTAATHVMIPARQEWWMSLPENLPTNRSHFIGFRLIKNSDVPVEIIGTTKAWEDSMKSSWYDSMKFYIQAYLSNEQDSKTSVGLERTLQHLETATVLAQESQIYEFPYHFMWARTKISKAAQEIITGNNDRAWKELHQASAKLQEILSELRGKLHPYEEFQIHLWTFRAESLLPSSQQNKGLIQHSNRQAQAILKNLKNLYPRQAELRDLQSSLSQKSQLEVVRESDIRFGTVE